MLPVLVSPVSYLWFDLMKLALPSFLLWLAGFYMLFHCILNIAAELTRFGDRLFFLGKEENAGTPLCPALLTPALPSSSLRLSAFRLVEQHQLGFILAKVECTRA